MTTHQVTTHETGAGSGGGTPTDLPAMDVTGRLARLRRCLSDAGADALLVTTLRNLRYLTGFTGSAGLLLVTADETLLATDGRYRTQAAEQLQAAGLAESVSLAIGGAQLQRDAIVALATDPRTRTTGTTGSRLGLEAENITWAAQRRWSDVLADTELVPLAGVVETLRQVKDAGELARMARAAAIADAALAEVLGLLADGRTEQQVALALDTAMRRLGSEDRAFETIVASGPNAAKPHARPSDRPIETGDPVVIDFGATFDGYRSDMTRTFCVGGEPSPELARLFTVVAEAQAAGVAAVAAGVVTGDIDKACRDHIAASGYASAFEHGTGHGVGLDIHEAPAVGQGSTAILTPGVVVTVEPGIYLAGLGGVRIEDTVVVTDQGCHPLTGFPKDIAA
ncbi:MAG TPA: Xaa-Pro peptidase family protein [Acidimicrobiales bacterium]|nr:Xaa-Pro peptidase family protein [Acidimicrobiales bacterium]